MADRIGQQLGNYRIISPIGHGGFADVYLGEHIYLQTKVAIKLLQMRLAEEDMEGFLNEARTIAHLVHPHIIRVMDFGIEDRTPFLVMDYAPKGTLRQRHSKGTRLPLDTVVDYTKQVAEALQYAHEKKVIHRDIKPENILLGENQQVLLSDFGIALVAQSTRYQNTQEVMGTAAYMAPEQLQGKPRRASDQYALGIVVYEWLCGDRPFHGSFTEVYSQHLFVPPPSLREKLPELPQAVEEVVLTALAKDPKERFTNIHAFATALEQACQIVPYGPIALSSELPSPNLPLPPTDTVAAFPSSLESRLHFTTDASPPPTKALSATPLADPAATSNLPNDGNTTPVLKMRSNTAIANRRQGLHLGRIVLLIGLALLVLLGSLGFFIIRSTNQMTTGNAHATATAQTNSTKIASTATIMAQAHATATATATALYNDYVHATSGTPVLDNPLSDNSQGNGWATGSKSCEFSGGAYHVRMSLKGYYEVCYDQPTFSNFVFQAQMTILKGDYGGIVFRTNKDNPFGYRFAFGLGICNFHYGNKELANSGIRANLNQTYLLTAIARGSSIYLYIDKQWVATVEDNSASSGGIGLMAGDFANEADVAFRNVQVWNL